MSSIVTVSQELAAPVLYPRGFLIAQHASEEFSALEHYRTQNLPGLVLQHDEVLACDTAVQGQDLVIVLGEVIPLSTGVISPQVPSAARALLDIHRARGAEGVEEALYDLAGRYAVLVRSGGRTVVYNDACGTRTVHADLREHRIASHLDILRRLAPDRERDERLPRGAAPQARWARTELADVIALTANQRLELEDGRLVRFFATGRNVARSLDHPQRLELVETLWEEQVQWLRRTGRPLALSITGGMDSRFMLAMAGEHRDSFRAMTYTTRKALDGEKPVGRWAQVMHDDQAIVKTLTPFLPADHSFIARGAGGSWVQDHEDVISRNSEHNHGRWILPGYLTLFPRRDTVHYRGNLMEIGRLHFGRVGETPGRSQVERLVRAAAAKRGDEAVAKALEVAEEGMEELQYDRIHPDYDLTDVFYWENRHSRWYGELLNETDVAFDSITPFNVRRIVDAFLAYAPQDRKDALLQKELIYRRNPYLMFPGFNSRSDLYRTHVSDGVPRQA